MSVVDTTFAYKYANHFPIIFVIFYLIIFILLILNSDSSHPLFRKFPEALSKMSLNVRLTLSGQSYGVWSLCSPRCIAR